MHYARLIGEEVRHRFGGVRRANLITLTLQTADLRSSDDCNGFPKDHCTLLGATRLVRVLGAEAVVVCSSALQTWSTENVDLPVLPICAPVARALQRSRLRRVGLIGIRTGDEEKSWQAALSVAGITDVLLPVPRDRQHLAEIVEREFANGVVTESARADVVRIVHFLRQAGARAIVVGTPEITTVLEDAMPVLPSFDVTELHALAAVDWMRTGSDSSRVRV